jgi:hypothetical protein
MSLETIATLCRRSPRLVMTIGLALATVCSSKSAPRDARVSPPASVADEGVKLITQTSPGSIDAARISRDGTRVALASGRLVRVYEAARFRETSRFEDSRPVTALEFSLDGLQLFIGHDDGTIARLDLAGVAGPAPVGAAAAMRQPVRRLAISPQGDLLAVAADCGSLGIVALSGPTAPRRVREGGCGNAADAIAAIAWHDAQTVLFERGNGHMARLAAGTGDERPIGSSAPVDARSSDALVVPVDRPGRALLVEQGSSKLVDRVSRSERALPTGCDAADPNVQFTANRPGQASLSASAEVLLLVCPPGNFYDAATASDTVRIVNVRTGAVRTMPTPGRFVDLVALSPSRRLIAASEHVQAGGDDPRYSRIRIAIWDLAIGRPIQEIVDRPGPIRNLSFSADETAVWYDRPGGRRSHPLVERSPDRVVLPPDMTVVAGRDGAVRIMRNQQEVATLNLVDEPAVPHGFSVSARSRYDTHRPDSVPLLHWSVDDEPLRLFPIELFMRDYYEPRLLARLFVGEAFPPLLAVKSLNRVQPTVEIEHVGWTDAASGLATVTVRVSRASDWFLRDGQRQKMTTDVYDLRLFRDGQLVGWAPADGVRWQLEPSTAERARQDDLPRWRELTHIGLDANGSQRLTFPVRLPQKADWYTSTISAYAFNADRVKSATATTTVERPNAFQPRQGRAYVITVGVNKTSSSPAWDLLYAVNDARSLGATLAASLSAGQQFAEVVPIRLVSDHDEPRPGEAEAVKAHLQTVLDLLAGRPVSPERIRAVPEAKKLRPARPEDLVLLAISSHGYTDTTGGFRFVLADIGPNQPREVTEALTRQTLSANTLSAWLRAVDAGEVVLIVDACQSEATLQTDGFKPGPMGSRGLGQLAFDKGMRVLAATKANAAALELAGIRSGVLTSALVRGLQLDADGPAALRGSRVPLDRWLAAAVHDVPQFLREGNATGFVTTGNAARHAFFGRTVTPVNQQTPVLFDFAGRASSVTLPRLSR